MRKLLDDEYQIPVVQDVVLELVTNIALGTGLGNVIGSGETSGYEATA
ncbi:MAG: hypothetical protein ACRDNW_08585 [Trebonia sp.]